MTDSNDDWGYSYDDRTADEWEDSIGDNIDRANEELIEGDQLLDLEEDNYSDTSTPEGYWGDGPDPEEELQLTDEHLDIPLDATTSARAMSELEWEMYLAELDSYLALGLQRIEVSEADYELSVLQRQVTELRDDVMRYFVVEVVRTFLAGQPVSVRYPFSLGTGVRAKTSGDLQLSNIDQHFEVTSDEKSRSLLGWCIRCGLIDESVALMKAGASPYPIHDPEIDEEDWDENDGPYICEPSYDPDDDYLHLAAIYDRPNIAEFILLQREVNPYKGIDDLESHRKHFLIQLEHDSRLWTCCADKTQKKALRESILGPDELQAYGMRIFAWNFGSLGIISPYEQRGVVPGYVKVYCPDSGSWCVCDVGTLFKSKVGLSKWAAHRATEAARELHVTWITKTRVGNR